MPKTFRPSPAALRAALKEYPDRLLYDVLSGHQSAACFCTGLRRGPQGCAEATRYNRVR